MGLPSTEPNQLFDKYIVSKDYSAVKVEKNGTVEPISPKQYQHLLDSDYFNGSVCLTKDTKSVGLKHKIFRMAQSIMSATKHSPKDPTICHAFIIVDNGNKEGLEETHSFTIAHAADEGIILENRDFLLDKGVTEIIIYRPKQADTRDLLATSALSSAFVKKENVSDVRSPERVAKYSYPDLLQVPFRTTSAVKKRKKTIDKNIVEWISSLLADFLLQKQISDTSGEPKAMICSGFASSVLQGVLFMQTLKDLKTSEILEFIQKNCGEKPDRKQLIQKIRATLLQETEPTDTVEKIFWNAFRKNKFLNYNSRFIMSMNLVKQLDRLT